MGWLTIHAPEGTGGSELALSTTVGLALAGSVILLLLGLPPILVGWPIRTSFPKEKPTC